MPPAQSPSTYAHNVRRLMARSGLTLREVVAATGLHERTVKAVLRGSGKPHPRTLHRLASGLGVSTDELFQPVSLAGRRLFDRRTNSVVDELAGSHPEWFEEWSEADFDELYSHFGTGGALSFDGARELVQSINEKRLVHRKVALLLESGEAELLIGVVELLYQKIAVVEV